MSLKAFHIVFIAASILLAFGFAAWAFVQYADSRRTVELVYGISSAVVGVVLIGYGKYVLRKLRHISYL
jgi:chromate transport protein ChrA